MRILRRFTKRANSKSGARAQGMVEFAMTLPILLLLILGIMEFGRLLFVYSSVISAAREAARYGAAGGDSGSGVPYYGDCAGIRAAAMRIGSIAGIPNDGIDITYDGVPDPEDNPNVFAPKGSCGSGVPLGIGDRIIVSVTAHFTPMQGIVPMPGIDVTSIVRRTLIINLDLD